MSQVEWHETAPAARFPSSPLWHPTEKRLYWSDVDARRLFRLDPETGEAETLLDDGQPVGAMALQADGSLLLFRSQGSVVAFRDGAIAETIVPAISDCRLTRYACAAADAEGRVVCAMLSDLHHPARIFLLRRDGKLVLIRETIGIPAGLAFAEDGRALLFSNAYATHPEVLRFAYDAASETPIAEAPMPFFNCIADTSRAHGVPGGLAPAADGSILLARTGDSMITRHVPTGERLSTFSVQVKRPIGICFGGDELKDIYITTAGAHRPFIDGAHAGEVVTVRDFMVRGAAPFPARIGIE